MNLLLYVPRPSGRGEELLSAVAPFISGGSLEVFPDLPSFAARIRRPKDPLSIALIWNPSNTDLREIVQLRDLLTGVRILLALPDQETETVALAHKVFPAYIAYVDDGIAEIVSVLGRLTKTGGGGASAGARRP